MPEVDERCAEHQARLMVLERQREEDRRSSESHAKRDADFRRLVFEKLDRIHDDQSLTRADLRVLKLRVALYSSAVSALVALATAFIVRLA